MPYFRDLDDELIQELIYLMRPQKQDPNTLLIKRGDGSDKIYFLKYGKVDIEVPLKSGALHFDSLNEGSCISIYSSFHEDVKQKFDFRCKTVCSFESIRTADLLSLERDRMELSDRLKDLRARIENNEKSSFDFYRYIPPSKVKENQAKWKKDLLQKKMRSAILVFSRQYRQKKAELGIKDGKKVDFFSMVLLLQGEKKKLQQLRKMQELR